MITAKSVWVYVFCCQNGLLLLYLNFFNAKKILKKKPNKTGANYLEHECVVYLYTCTNDIMPI